jgi:two-component sensor histidine kinase
MNRYQQLEISEIPNLPDASGNDVPRARPDAGGPAFVLDEANHRIRNMLAMIEAVVRQTRSGSVEDYRAKVLARISGFREFHEIVGCRQGESIAIADLLKQSMGPYCAKLGQVRASGPDVDLQPELALALHLIFHELALNASKYGALTSPAGCVTVGWDLHTTGGANPKLAVVWTERGGPAVIYPQHHGFGSRVITRALQGYGKVQLDFHPAGVACYMLIDLERWAPHSREKVRTHNGNN